MRLEDTTDQSSNAGVRTIFSSTSARHQLEMLGPLRIHLLGLYHAEVGREWGSNGRMESDYLHHFDIALTGARQVVHRGEVLDIEPGKVYCYPGNTPLERRWERRSRVVFMKFRLEWLPGVDPLLDWPGRKPVLVGSCDLSAWREWVRPNPQITCNQLLKLQGVLFGWVAAAVPGLEEVIAAHLRTHARFQPVFKFIEQNLGASLRVEELARVHGTSLHAFSVAFSRDTGMSPKAYIKRRLSQEAIQLLTNTDLKLKEVAEKLKFWDEYHFSRFFARTNGMAPSRYRVAFTENGAGVPFA